MTNQSTPPNSHDSHDDIPQPRLRSRRWFDDPSDPGMTALYLERYMNYGITREELQSGKPIIGIAQRSEERRVGKECRSRCDWSSDVCSSDLSLRSRHDRALSRALYELRHHARRTAVGQADHRHRAKIGRASCRERV